MLPALGGKFEQHDRDLARGAGRAAQANKVLDPPGQHVGALEARMHVAVALARVEGASAIAPGARLACMVGAAAEDDRSGCAVEFGDGDHDGRFYRQQPAIGGAPLFERLKLGGMTSDIGDIQAGEHLLGGPRVIVGWSADQRKSP